VIELIGSLPLRRGPGAFMNVSMREYRAILLPLFGLLFIFMPAFLPIFFLCNTFDGI
jgi:hypothetical protein